MTRHTNKNRNLIDPMPSVKTLKKILEAINANEEIKAGRTHKDMRFKKKNASS